MDTQTREYLEKLYLLAVKATATTNFYHHVYKYIAFIKQSASLTRLLEKDDEDLHIYDIERRDTRPVQQQGESDADFFLKKMSHMSSGDRVFLSHFMGVIERDIYNPLDWHYTDGYQSEEVSLMLNGKKKVNFITKLQARINKDTITTHPSTDYEKIYIQYFPHWKTFITDFHTLLVEKIEKSPEYTTAQVFNLKPNGAFTYLIKSGNFDTTSEEYKILKMLYDHDGTVLYEDILKHVYKREISKVEEKVKKMAINNHIRKIKERLGILPKTPTSLPDIIINHKGVGYSLDIQVD